MFYVYIDEVCLCNPSVLRLRTFLINFAKIKTTTVRRRIPFSIPPPAGHSVYWRSFRATHASAAHAFDTTARIY